MATRTLLVIPQKGGKIREVHVSMWIVLPIVLFLGVGALGIYWLKRNWSPDKEQKTRTQTLQAQNALMETRYKQLHRQFSRLQDRIKEIKVQELEIRRISGLEKSEEESSKKRSSFLSFVTSPFQSRKSNSAEKLLAEATLTAEYYNVLLENVTERPSEFQRIPTLWPLGEKYTFISFGFGERLNPFTGQILPHLGIDFPAPTGTPVYATAKGTVLLVENHKSFGKRIKIRHHNGYTTAYAHLRSFKVRLGRRVKKGQIIGTVGSSGYSTGPHLHYEVIYQDVHQDPMDYLFPLDREQRSAQEAIQTF